MNENNHIWGVIRVLFGIFLQRHTNEQKFTSNMIHIDDVGGSEYSKGFHDSKKPKNKQKTIHWNHLRIIVLAWGCLSGLQSQVPKRTRLKRERNKNQIIKKFFNINVIKWRLDFKSPVNSLN